MEVAYSGKPAIVVPLFFDQPMNGEMLARHGGAEVYSKFDMSNGQKLEALIRKILEDSEYPKNAERLSNLLAKQPVNPIDRLISHAEFAAEFQKLPGLDPYSRHLTFIEFFFLDILALLIFSIFVPLCYLFCRPGGVSKPKCD